MLSVNCTLCTQTQQSNKCCQWALWARLRLRYTEMSSSDDFFPSSSAFAKSWWRPVILGRENGFMAQLGLFPNIWMRDAWHFSNTVWLFNQDLIYRYCPTLNPCYQYQQRTKDPTCRVSNTTWFCVTHMILRFQHFEWWEKEMYSLMYNMCVLRKSCVIRKVKTDTDQFRYYVPMLISADNIELL